MLAKRVPLDAAIDSTARAESSQSAEAPEPVDENHTQTVNYRRLNINEATEVQLQRLPGIGPVLAQRIVDYREQHGGFSDVAELNEVPGIGEGKLTAIEDYIYIEPLE